MPTVVTYSCSARSSYEPISCRTWTSFSCPSAISFSSLMKESWRSPVAGFVAHAAVRNNNPITPDLNTPDLKVGPTTGCLGIHILFCQRALKRAEQQDHEPCVRAVAHQAHAPDLAGEGTEAAADLDAVFLEQHLPHGRVVHA